MSIKEIAGFAADTCYGVTRYPWGLTRPKVTWGHFPDSHTGRLQKILFENLQQQGFKRTVWQLVFPGQNAGLIGKGDLPPDSSEEYHVRFYGGGIIDCEREKARFDLRHWCGERECGLDFLHRFLDKQEAISQLVRDDIRSLLGKKPYSQDCLRRSRVRG